MRLFATLLLFALIGPGLSAELSVKHSPTTPRSGEKVIIQFEGRAELPSPVVEYQVVLPGSYIARKDPAFQKDWTAVPLNKSNAGYAAELPAQKHRTLVRYRIRAQDGTQLPPANDSEPNYAYFVYDGVPAWKGAIDPSSWDPRKNAAVQFPPEVMSQVQTYFLIGKQQDVENVTWYQQSFDKEYRHTGTVVADGKVYDHVPFRARGGEWRFAMGKNMWKFNFNKGHHLEAKDDYGNKYRTKWGKLNLRACIQQGDYGRRGEQGMYEAVGFRLFNLAGVDAPRTHWVTMRIIDEKEENPSDQYKGDFWGLYLAIENEDEDFLKEHGLPEGNVFKMKFGQGELSSDTPHSATAQSDLAKFLQGLRRRGSEGWWRANLDLPRYYSYRSIVEGIHHYDIGNGKNYDFYLNPETRKWCVIPWDIDLTWGDHMYGNGRDPFVSSLMDPAIQREYQNRLREIRDLLFNPDETGRLIDECAAIIYRPGQPSIVDADRMKWDYHPIMSSRYAMSGKADKGLFYQGVGSRNFAGMVRQMKDYVRQRCAYIDRSLLADSAPPPTPSIHYTGKAGFPRDGLSFSRKAVSNPAAVQWRLGRIDKGKSGGPGHYEITPVWESDSTEATMNVPGSDLVGGGTYRARCRVQDSKGWWSHWSEPIEFTVSEAK